MVLSAEALRAPWSRLGGPNAVSLPAWLLTFTFALLPTTADIEAISNSDHVPSDAATWFLIRIVGQLVLGLVLWLAWLTYLRPGDPQPRPVLAVATFVLASAIRALVVQLGYAWWGLPMDGWVDRIATTTLGTAALLAMATLVVDGYRRHRDAQQNLQDELAREEALSREALTAIDAYRDELLSRVQETVEVELATIVADTRGTSDAVTAQKLSRLAESVVRPLGRELMTPGPVALVTDGTHAMGAVRSTFGGFWAVLRDRPFTPAMSAIVILVLISLSAGNQVGIVNGVLAATTMAALSWAILGLAHRIYVPDAWSQHPRVASTLIVAAWVIAASAAAVTSTALITSRVPAEMTQGVGLESPIRSALFVLVWIVGPPVALAVSRQWREAEEQLQGTLKAVSHLTAELNLQAWFERHSLGVRVHGAAQSELVAAALRIVNDPQCDQEVLLRDLGDRIRVRLRETNPADWRTSLHDMGDVWAFSIDLRVEVAHEASEALERDPSLALAAVEIVREGIVNAVRAGAADRVDVTLSVHGLDLVIVVVDDGDGLMGQGPPGAGTRLLEDACLEWTRRDSGAGTVLRAVLATTRGRNDDVVG